MKRILKSTSNVPSGMGIKHRKPGKLSIPLKEMIRAVSQLGDRMKELDDNGEWRSNNSLWSQLATHLACKLSITNTPAIRKYIYGVWNRKSGKLRSYFTNEPLKKKKATNLQQLPSISSFTKICTRSKEAMSSDTDVKIKKVQEHLIEFSYEEWRQIYHKDDKSFDSHFMDPSWTDVFYEKLVDYKLVTCSIIFKKSTLRKKDSRKRNTALFKCYGRCQEYPTCSLKVYMILAQPIIVGKNVMFRVRIEGTQQHDNSSTSTARLLKGKKRVRMAQSATEHGILKTYEDNLLNADDNLLKCNNYTQVPSMDVLKTAVKEQANNIRFHENMYVELEMMLHSMKESDDKSNIENKGYIQVLQTWPFATIFYTELQLLRFIEYCSSTKDSYIHIDATGSVVKALPDQRKPYLYLICFKDGEDPSNLLPLAGALLTDHTAVSISTWLSIVRRGIVDANKGRFIRPSYIVIDFSPALLNTTLLSLNNINIHSYLRWCFNAIQKKYTSDQLYSMSCIRFCCAHVIHAFTRSLSKIKIKKILRHKATIVFATLLNCNDFDQIYGLIGCIILIFGSPDLDNAEDTLNGVIKMCDEFNSDFQTFFDDENISDAQHLIEQQLAELDDNFLSSEPIIHQSPFTKLARERSPILSTLIDKPKQMNETQITNPFYSKELIKVYYKWIAYLPIFTGLMYEFQDRYASDTNYETNDNMFGHGRISNATIESFFKILEHSIFRQNTNLRPAQFLLKLYATTNARLKANLYSIQQTGSKRRGRSTKKQTDITKLTENWKNKGSLTAKRGIYFTTCNIPILTASDIRSRLQEKLEMRQKRALTCSNSKTTSYTSTTDKSNEKGDGFTEAGETEDDLIEAGDTEDLIETGETEDLIEAVQETNQHTNSTPYINQHQTKQAKRVSNRRTKSTKSFDNYDDTNEPVQIISKPSDHEKDQQTLSDEFLVPNGWPTHTMVGKLRLPYPHFNIGPTFFGSKRYSVANTCSLDSSLFLLYYIYVSRSENFRSLLNPNVLVCEQLRKTFELVEKEGWDIARLYWISLHTTHPRRNAPTQHHNLFTTADNNVFQHVRVLQKQVIKSTCTSKDCPKSVRVKHSVDISMPQLSNKNNSSIIMTDFSEQRIVTCGETIGPNKPTSYDGFFKIDDCFPAKNGKGNRTMFICDSDRIVEPHQFVDKSPPFLLLNVGQMKIDIKKNLAIAPTFKQLPLVINVGEERYHLAGAVCLQSDHFTATIVHVEGGFSKYDDLWRVGVKKNEGGDDFVETAVYVIEMNKH